jgi:hypothetical protein
MWVPAGKIGTVTKALLVVVEPESGLSSGEKN